jgi:hypothetical protein
MIETPEDMKKAVLAQLVIGEENAKHGELIARNLGEKDTRRFRLAVIALLEDRHPVIGSQKGYYIARDINDIIANRAVLMHYLKMTGYHYKLLGLAGAQFSPQEKMKL